MRILAILTLVFTCFIAVPALAQTGANSFLDTSSSLALTPSYPQPGQEVEVKLNDYSSGFYGANVMWFINGEEVPNSVNRRSISFKAGNSGSTQVVEAVLESSKGAKKTVRTIVKPVYLDIILEPQTRVPDFYLGRSLPSFGSLVNATAIVSGSQVDPSGMVYTWRVNQKVVESGPIRARNKVSFETPIGSSFLLSLSVTDTRGLVIAKRIISVLTVVPEIKFYEVSTLFGQSQFALVSNTSLIGNSLTIKAEPYYLDSRVYNDPDVIEWKIDRVKTNSPSGANPYEVTLKKTGDTGSSQLEFHVRDTKLVLQGAKADIRVNY